MASPSVVTVHAVSDHLDEFLQIEWFENRAADSTGGYAVESSLSCGCENDDVPHRAIHRADMLDELESVEPWHHQVENDHVLLVARVEKPETCFAILSKHDVKVHTCQ